ncbi:MAG: Flp pilus assembly complex ATPase component TadA [Opitutales bacterium]|nr:Flp pilus assembly complex ATPase component TadA [Opitutales bacterium]
MKISDRLLEYLVEGELINEAALTRAVEMSKKVAHGEFIGSLLVREGIIRENDLIEVLCRELRLRRYHSDVFYLDPTMASVIPPENAIRWRMVPLGRENDVLLVAMTDPMDVVSIDQAHEFMHCEIEPVVCSAAQLKELAGALYAGSQTVDHTSEDFNKSQFGNRQMQHISFGSSDGEVEDVPVDDDDMREWMDTEEGQTAVRFVNWLLVQAVQEGASDLHISPEKEHVQIRMRVDGSLKDFPALAKVMQSSVISRIKILARMDIAVTRIPQDGRFSANVGDREINIRVSSIPTVNGENLVLRLLDASSLVLQLDKLGVRSEDAAKIRSSIQMPHGLFLNTGPTGSGKTTTLYSILALLNQPDVNIITVEDPVEYRIPRIRQVELNTRAGSTFASSLKSILRQDPDIIMVGEIRDLETGRIAVQAALTGHLVLSTLHTNDSIGAITRLMDMGIEPFLVSSVLNTVMAQRLIRRLCPVCAQPSQPTAETLKHWNVQPNSGDHFLEARGCEECNHIGYRGRLGIYEVLMMNPSIRDLILNRASEAQVRNAANQAGGFYNLYDDAVSKIRQGLTTFEEGASIVMV